MNLGGTNPSSLGEGEALLDMFMTIGEKCATGDATQILGFVVGWRDFSN